MIILRHTKLSNSQTFNRCLKLPIIFTLLDLQNDLKELLGKIEEGLYKIHADEKMKKSDQKPEIIQQQTTDESINHIDSLLFFFAY